MNIGNIDIISKTKRAFAKAIKLAMLLAVIWYMGGFLSAIMIAPMSIGVKVAVSFMPALLLVLINKPKWSFMALLFTRPMVEPLWQYRFMGQSILGLISFVYLIIAVYMIASSKEFKVYAENIKWYYLIMLIAAASIFNGINITASVSAMTRYLLLLSLFLLGYNFTKTFEDGLKIIRIILMSAVFPIGYGIYQVVMGLGVQRFKSFQGDLAGVARINATFSLSNAFAFFLSIIILLSVFYIYNARSKSEKNCCFVLIAGALFCLLKTHVRTAWVGLFVSLCVVSIFHKQFRKYFLISIAIVLPIAFNTLVSRFSDLFMQPEYGYNSLEFRTRITTQLMNNAFPKKMFLGFGIGNANEATLLHTTFRNFPHNDYMKVLIETGIFGFFAYTWFLLKMLIYLITMIRKKINYNVNTIFLSIMIFYCLISSGQNVFTYVTTSGYVFCIMGIATKLNEISMESGESGNER
jgi:O-antigen ligase